MEKIDIEDRECFHKEQKLTFVLESLSYPYGIGAYCRSNGIHDTLFYKWKEHLQNRANEVYGPKKTNEYNHIKFLSKEKGSDSDNRN